MRSTQERTSPSLEFSPVMVLHVVYEFSAKRWSLVLALGAFMSLSGLASADDTRLIKRDESGNVYDAVLGSLVLESTSVGAALGRILKQARVRIPERSIHFYLHSRTTVPSGGRLGFTLDSENLLALAGKSGSATPGGSITADLSGAFMLKALEHICSLGDLAWSVETEADARILSIHIGPPELVDKTWSRIAYKPPPQFHDSLSDLPTRLHATGPAIAYAADERVLVVIDQDSSSAFKLLDLLPFTVLAGAKGDPPIRGATGTSAGGEAPQDRPTGKVERIEDSPDAAD